MIKEVRFIFYLKLFLFTAALTTIVSSGIVLTIVIEIFRAVQPIADIFKYIKLNI